MIKDTFNHNDAVLPAYFPGGLIRMLLEQGFNETTLLENTGLTLDKLLDEDARLSFNQHRILVQNAIDVTGNPHLGFIFGKQLNVTSLGILGYAAMSCKTLASALDTITKYFKIRAPLLELSVQLESQAAQSENQEAAIQVDESLNFGDMRYFLISSALYGIERILSYYIGQQPGHIGQQPGHSTAQPGDKEQIGNNEQIEKIVTRAKVTFEQPNEWEAIAEDISFPIEFNQPFNRVYFPASYLTLQFATADPQTEQSTKRICENLLQRINQQTGIISRVREFILKYEGSYPSLDQTAQHLCVSPRTLRRELRNAGTTYQQVVDGIREKIAVQYLTTTRKPVFEIAVELGYNDLSNFGRAFKRWTGKPPSAYRS